MELFVKGAEQQARLDKAKEEARLELRRAVAVNLADVVEQATMDLKDATSQALLDSAKQMASTLGFDVRWEAIGRVVDFDHTVTQILKRELSYTNGDPVVVVVPTLRDSVTGESLALARVRRPIGDEANEYNMIARAVSHGTMKREEVVPVLF